MKRHWRLTILTVLLMVVFVAGCAKKEVLKQESMGTNKSTAVTKAPEETKPTAKTPEKAEAAVAVKEKTETATVPGKELYEFVDIHFDFDTFNLKDDARGVLGKHAAWLNKNSNATGVIEGHCDERGTAEYNLALGQRRADAAAKYLMDMGIDGNRIKTISYGKERPLDPGHNEEAWAKNRRAHFVISGIK